jgi:hypothetical protein
LPIALVLDIRLEGELRLVREVCKTLNTSLPLERTAHTPNRDIEGRYKISPFLFDEGEHPGAELLDLLEGRIERHVYEN